MKDLNLPILFDLNHIQSSIINDKALLTQLEVLKITIEKSGPSQATISKSRTLILDNEFIFRKKNKEITKKYIRENFY